MGMSRPIGLGLLLLLTVSIITADLVHPSPYDDPSTSREVTGPTYSRGMGQRLRNLVIEHLGRNEKYIDLFTETNLEGEVNKNITLVFDGKLINSDGTWTGRKWRSVTVPDGVTIGQITALEVFKAPNVNDLYSVTLKPLTPGLKKLEFDSRNSDVAEVIVNLDVRAAPGTDAKAPEITAQRDDSISLRPATARGNTAQSGAFMMQPLTYQIAQVMAPFPVRPAAPVQPTAPVQPDNSISMHAVEHLSTYDRNRKAHREWMIQNGRVQNIENEYRDPAF